MLCESKILKLVILLANPWLYMTRWTPRSGSLQEYLFPSLVLLCAGVYDMCSLLRPKWSKVNLTCFLSLDCSQSHRGGESPQPFAWYGQSCYKIQLRYFVYQPLLLTLPYYATVGLKSWISCSCLLWIRCTQIRNKFYLFQNLYLYRLCIFCST